MGIHVRKSCFPTECNTRAHTARHALLTQPALNAFQLGVPLLSLNFYIISVLFFLLVVSLLRYISDNKISRNIKFSTSKVCTTQWFLIYSQACITTTTTIQFQNTSTPEETCTRGQLTAFYPCPQPPTTIHLLSVSMGCLLLTFQINGIIWNAAFCVFFHVV